MYIYIQQKKQMRYMCSIFTTHKINKYVFIYISIAIKVKSIINFGDKTEVDKRVYLHCKN